MSDQPTQAPSQESSDQPVKKPIPLTERIIVILVGLVPIAFGLATWKWPELISSWGYEPGGRGSRRVYFLLNLAWNRVVGTGGILFGLLIIWGAIARKNGSPEPKV